MCIRDSLEGAGYVSQTSLTNTLSTYALQSALGTTNTTVGNIDTRLTTVENAGYVTASGLSGYNFATQGYVSTAVTDLATESYVDTAVAGVSGGGGEMTVSGTNASHNTTIYPLKVETVSSSSTQVEEGIGTGIEFRVER